jgi:hypothetical protein
MEQLPVAQLLKKFLTFMEPEDKLPYSHWAELIKYKQKIYGFKNETRSLLANTAQQTS